MNMYLSMSRYEVALQFMEHPPNLIIGAQKHNNPCQSSTIATYRGIPSNILWRSCSIDVLHLAVLGTFLVGDVDGPGEGGDEESDHHT